MKEAVLECVESLKKVATNPRKAIEDWNTKTGKKAVGCFPIYTPEELVYAADALPVGMWGGKRVGNHADKYLQSFCCSVMKINTEQSLLGDYDKLSAVILTTYCDTMKCILENWKVSVPHLNIIPMVDPQNRKTKSGKSFFIDELHRVKGELEKTLDTTITESSIENALKVYEEYRETMRKFVRIINDYPVIFDAVTRHQIIKAAYFMDKKIYTEKIKRIILELENEEAESVIKKRIILTGLLAEPDALLEIFNENDMHVVADDLAQESRQFRISTPNYGTWYERMTERLAAQDGCTFLYDYGKTRSKKLIDLKEKYNADAIVFCQMKFCDPDEFDYPIIKKDMEAAGIPMLHIEIEQHMKNFSQLRTRIQGFAEMIV